MPVLSDKWIRKMSKEEEMISPFEEKQIRGERISYGLSSFGYDARVSDAADSADGQTLRSQLDFCPNM